MVPAVIGMLVLSVGIAATAAAQDANVEGEKAFAERKCTVCHSIAGKGNPKGSLDGVGSRLSRDEIRAWLVDPTGMAAKTKATRKPPMKQVDLPASDVDALVGYLQTLKKK